MPETGKTRSSKTQKSGPNCSSCDHPFDKKDGWIQCSACLEYLHSRCSGLSRLALEVMDEEAKKPKTKKNKLRYTCEVCDETVTDLLTNFQKFKKMNNTLSEMTNEFKQIRHDLDNKIENLNKRMTKCEEATQKSAGLSARVKKTEEKVENSGVADLEEMREIEKRKNNLIFFGVPENDNEELEDIIEEEFSDIQKILENKAQFDWEDITDMFRLGKKPETEAEKPRPLLIKFQDEDVRGKILKVSGDLKLMVNNEVVPIYVSMDKTPKQREDYKKLRAELKRRKEKETKNLVIRGNKIVELEFFQERRARSTKNILANIRKKKTEQPEPEDDREPGEDKD